MADRVRRSVTLIREADFLFPPLLLASSLLAIPVKDTVWWNSTAGTVTEHRDDNGADCSLTFQNDAGNVVFRWDGSGAVSVTAIDWNWELPDDWRVPVAMRIGDTWLSNAGNSAVITGVGHGNTVSFPISQSVEGLLRPAERIEVQITGATLSITLDHPKVGTLLDRVHMCRDVARR